MRSLRSIGILVSAVLALTLVPTHSAQADSVTCQTGRVGVSGGLAPTRGGAEKTLHVDPDHPPEPGASLNGQIALCTSRSSVTTGSRFYVRSVYGYLKWTLPSGGEVSFSINIRNPLGAFAPGFYFPAFGNFVMRDDRSGLLATTPLFFQKAGYGFGINGGPTVVTVLEPVHWFTPQFQPYAAWFLVSYPVS